MRICTVITMLLLFKYVSLKETRRMSSLLVEESIKDSLYGERSTNEALFALDHSQKLVGSVLQIAPFFH